MTYTYDTNFKRCDAIGKQGEQDIVAHLSANYHIQQYPQGAGRSTDILCTHKWKADRQVRVEIKTDTRAAGTGNAFIETLSNDVTNALGWAYTCEADIIAYYLPQYRKVYWVKPSAIRFYLSDWQRQYKEVAVFNPPNYHSHGLLVPIGELGRISEAVRNI